MIRDSRPAGRPTRPRGSLPTITLPAHPLARYVRSRLGVVDGVVRWTVPRTVLGVVPIGVRRVAVPLDEVAAVRVANHVTAVHLVVGVTLIVGPLLTSLGWAGLPLALVGAWVALASFSGSVAVTRTGGGTDRAPVCFGHRMDAELYAEAVAALAGEARAAARVHQPAAGQRTGAT